MISHKIKNFMLHKLDLQRTQTIICYSTLYFVFTFQNNKLSYTCYADYLIIIQNLSYFMKFREIGTRQVM